MGRIETTFASLRSRGKKALVAYLCVGDPSPEESVDLALACVRAGADVLELGSPYSDPSADGPAIARASERAIRAGGGRTATLRAARAIRAAAPDVPLVLFGYFNPLFVRGEARAADDVADAGIDALLVVDLPLDEGADIRARAAARGVSFIPLLTPTSTAARAAMVRAAAARAPAGFVYYVSVTGVTGVAAAPVDVASAEAGRLRDATGLPVVVGFGIDSADKARAAARHADGVVVGTAIVKCIEDGKTPAARSAAVTRLVEALRAGLDA